VIATGFDQKAPVIAPKVSELNSSANHIPKEQTPIDDDEQSIPSFFKSR